MIMTLKLFVAISLSHVTLSIFFSTYYKPSWELEKSYRGNGHHQQIDERWMEEKKNYTCYWHLDIRGLKIPLNAESACHLAAAAHASWSSYRCPSVYWRSVVLVCHSGIRGTYGGGMTGRGPHTQSPYTANNRTLHKYLHATGAKICKYITLQQRLRLG